jgi:hypothetical protein
MATEEQLLNTIFDDGSSATEKATAVVKLKKLTGKNRAALVEKYTNTASSPSSSSSSSSSSWSWASDYAARQIGQLTADNIRLRLEISRLELKIEGLKIQHAQEADRRTQMDDLIIQGHQTEVRRLRAEARRLKTERDAFELQLSILKGPAFLETKCAAPGCVKMFRPSRRGATTCSPACRKALSRARGKAAIEVCEV